MNAVLSGSELGKTDITEERKKLSETRTALAWVSVLAIIVCLVSFGNAENKPDTALFLMIVSVFMGLYVFVGTMETTLLRSLVGLKASVIAWLLLFSYFAFVAKAKAMGDINSIFHVDAALLPMTLLATTVLQVMSMLFWPVIVVSVLIAVVAFFWREEFSGSIDGVKIIVALVVSAGAQVMFSLFVWGWVNADEQRHNTIYRIAHFADFNSSFRCSNLNEGELSVLFVDPAKSQVIVAPKIEEKILRLNSKAAWLQPLTIPSEFPKIACVSLAAVEHPEI